MEAAQKQASDNQQNEPTCCPPPRLARHEPLVLSGGCGAAPFF